MVLPWRHQNKGGLNGRRTLYMSRFSIRNSKQSIFINKAIKQGYKGKFYIGFDNAYPEGLIW